MLALSALVLLSVASCSESKFNSGAAAKQSSDAIPDCKLMGQGDKNILLMLDNSESQIISDPDNVRGTGALEFIDRLISKTDDKQKSKNKSTASQYRAAIAWFADAATNGSGWHDVNSTTRTALADDVTKATIKPYGFTNYHAALTLAYDIFRQREGNDRDGVAIRNFLVFLTDGDPTMPQPDPKAEINADMERLVGGLKVEVITVAVGAGVTPKGEDLLRSMAAAPNVGTTNVANDNDTSSSSSFIKAATPAELALVWRSIEAKVSDPCEKP